MKVGKIPEVIALLNSFHSLEGSDAGDMEYVQAAIIFCKKRIEKLTGRNPFYFTGKLDSAIVQLYELAYQKTNSHE